MRRLATAVLLVVTSCGGAADDRLVVFAASSLTEVFTRLVPDARLSFAGSDRLASQIREGARADVFASADEEHPARLHAERLAEQPRVFATNRLVLVVRKSAPIDSVPELRGPSVRLVLASPLVPVGAYTRRALRAMGAEDLLRRVVSEEQDVKGVLGKIVLEEADAGFVYATDARAAGSRVRTIELPARVQVPIRYAVCVLAGTPNRERAEALVSRLLDDEGRRVLAAAGFGLP